MKPIISNIIGKILVDREGFEIGVVNDLIKNTSTGEIEEFILKPNQHYLSKYDKAHTESLKFSINDVHKVKEMLILK